MTTWRGFFPLLAVLATAACGAAGTGEDAGADGEVAPDGTGDVETDGTDGDADGDGDTDSSGEAETEGGADGDADVDPGRCGDGTVQTERGEACDDGNTVGGDGCSADCTSDETCGNGITDPGEACDGEDWCDDACRDTRTLDTDGDTIRDLDEGPADADTDGDGTVDLEDTDSDGDGLLDADEAGDDDLSTPPVDTDDDTVPDFRDLDSDDDGMGDAVEGAGDFDGDTVPDFRDLDSDGDGLPDATEAGPDPDHPLDSDGDGHPDCLDTDSDEDGISDAVEGTEDPDGDGTPSYRDLDSDGDGVADVVEGTSDFDGDMIPAYLDLDADGDGLPDRLEMFCSALGIHSSQRPDTDGDGFSDLAEHAVGSDLCDPTSDVYDFVEFYFELPHGAPERSDTLHFFPQVRRTDVFFNMDTTGSMGGEITNLRSGLAVIMTETRARVGDAAFGVGQFEDYPVSPYGGTGDLPWLLLQVPTAISTLAQAAVDALSLGFGSDWMESGIEALYQIATGAGTSWTGGSVPPYAGPGGGGVGFRTGTLPLVLHVTDAPSHEAADYTAGGIVAHTRAATYAALGALGARVVTINSDGGFSPTVAADLIDISTQTDAVVPVCAFRTGAASWRCGASQCCTGIGGAAVPPTAGSCVLQYVISTNGSGLGTAVVDGIDALVKYTTFDAYAVVRDDGDPGTIDTTCFLKAVEALAFVPPPLEPERSCTPAAVADSFLGAAYDNGYRGVATGTATSSRVGSELQFTVRAENDGCVFPGWEAQLFTAYIDIVDVTTGQVLDTQIATIIVPPRIL